MKTITITIGDDGRMVQEDIEKAVDLFRYYKTTLERSEEAREKRKICPLCNQSIRDYKISLTKFTVNKLAKVYRHFRNAPQGTIVFSPRDVGATDDANFSKLHHFGLLYRPTDENGKTIRRGYYGMNRKYVGEFFAGTRSIPEHIWRNVVTEEKTPSEKRVTIKDIKSLGDLEKEYGDIRTEYKLHETAKIDLDRQPVLF